MKISSAELKDALAAQTAIKSNQVGSAQTAQINLRLLEQASVAMKQLTGDPLWDVFLQRLQVFIDEERKLMVAMADAIALPNLTSEQILQAQRHLLASKHKVEAWEQILELPKQLSGMARQSGAAA